MTAAWKHDDLALDLAQHLQEKTQRMVWTDMQLGPAGSPRPDAYSLAFSFSQFTPLAYEVKISTSDFRRDVSAGKWQSYLRFASAVTFAVPAGLIGKDDIPAGCGLMVRNETGWRTVKAPTLRAVENLPRDAWLKLMMDGLARLVDATQPRRREEFRMIAQLEKRFGREVAELLRDRQMATYSYERATEELRKATKQADEEYASLMEKARERAARDAGIVDTARRELARALGLAPDASTMAISSAARQAASRLEQDAEVQRLQTLLDRVRGALDDATKPMPPIARAA